MSRQTEKVLKQLNAYIDEHHMEFESEEELNALIQQFMERENAKASFGKAALTPETADDYLELAEEATSKKRQLEYVNKALALEPGNLDAGRIRAALTAKTPLDLLDELPQLLEEGNRQMEKEGFFTNECKGHFWGILETRPYMRLRHVYMRMLTLCGMLRLAAKECEGMIELCENDNLGIRYDLMHLYAMLEEEKPAKALMKKYPEDDTQMLLPLSILHFKLGQGDKALEVLKRLNQVNKDTKKFLKTMASGNSEKGLPEIGPYGYRPFCMEELTVEVSSYPFLFENTMSYFVWAYKALQEETRKKRTNNS